MAKISISIPDELANKLESLSRDKGRTTSGVVAEALSAYLPRLTGGTPPEAPSPDGSPNTPSASSQTQTQAPPSSPSGQADTQIGDVRARLLELEARVTNQDSVVEMIYNRFGELDERLSKLWHDVHDR